MNKPLVLVGMTVAGVLAAVWGFKPAFVWLGLLIAATVAYSVVESCKQYDQIINSKIDEELEVRKNGKSPH